MSPFFQSFVKFIPGNTIAFKPLIIGIVILTLLNVTLKSWKALQKIGFKPGFRTIIGPDSILSELLGGYIPYICSGRSWPMRLKHKPYENIKQDIISHFQIYPTVRSFFYVSDPYATKEITSNRARFPKYTPTYKVLEYFGSNILTTEHEQWKHQRKLTAPTFSEKNNRLVWEETVRIVQDMFDNWGRENKEVDTNHCLDITLPITLMVISGAGFGRRIPWAEDKNVPAGHTMSFKNALQRVSSYMILIFVLPKLFFSLTKKLKAAYQAKDELLIYMKEMIEQRRENLSEERYDLFSALLQANEFSTKDEGKLSESELLGNIFIFLLAGHETTAHTMCFALGLLALEQEEQEKMYQNIVSILGTDRDVPHYDEFNALTYVMAVINETLRLFPPVNVIPKEASEDVLLPVASYDGKIESFAVQEGTCLFIDVVGLHYNPQYWDAPETYNPIRFLGEYNRDAFIPFSAGARACIGRGFGETEMVAALTMIILKYKVEVKNPELYAGMSKLEQRAKLLATKPSLTLTPLNVPLVFKKRTL